jgi:hypothetical protein
MLKIHYGHEEPRRKAEPTTPANMDLFALAGASVIFEKRGVLCSGATWKQSDKECTRHYHHAADLIRLWRKHQ